MSGFSLRRATAADVPAMAALFRRVQEATRPFKPDLHTPEDDRAFQLGVVTNKKAWLAEESGVIVGFIGYGSGWVDQLYVDLGHQGRGIGDALLKQVKSDEHPLQLWVFQENVRARRFYERRGFRLVRETDGAGNQEKEPDALLEWRKGQPAPPEPRLIRRDRPPRFTPKRRRTPSPERISGRGSRSSGC